MCWEWNNTLGANKVQHNLVFNDGPPYTDGRRWQPGARVGQHRRCRQGHTFYCNLHGSENSSMKGTITETADGAAADHHVYRGGNATTFNADDKPPLPECWCVPITGINLMRIRVRQRRQPGATGGWRAITSLRGATLRGLLICTTRRATASACSTRAASCGYNPGQGHDLGDSSTLSSTAGPTCGTLLKDVPSGIQQACAVQLPATCTTTGGVRDKAQPAVFDTDRHGAKRNIAITHLNCKWLPP